jgi:hypothetical protein
MTRFVFLDEIHIEVLVPADRSARAVAALRRALAAPAFLRRLRQAVRPLFVAHPALAAVRVRIAR